MRSRIVLYADEGMIITDGKDTYGKEIFLAEGISAEDFYEITEEDYEKILEIDTLLDVTNE